MKTSQAAYLVCALFLGGCDTNMSEPLEEPTIEELWNAPNGREVMLSLILRDEVIVFSSEYLPHDGFWEGHGDVPLIQAAWECSGGLTINQHAGEYLQVIAPAPGTLFGKKSGTNKKNSSAIQISQCVSERANERFAVSLHKDAKQLLSLTGGQPIMPPSRSEGNVENAHQE